MREARRPSKLRDYFLEPAKSHKKNGGASTRKQTAHARTGKPAPSPSREDRRPFIDSEESQSSSSSPAVFYPEDRSPAKTRQRMSPPFNQDPLHSPSSVTHGNCNDDIIPQGGNVPIESFPTSSDPMSSATLRDMLLSFKSSLSKEMHEYMAKFTSEIQLVGERVDHVENKMAEFAGTFNNLVDAHNAREDDIDWLKAKVADLEDRSCRNNLKIRGIPESVPPEDLRSYVQSIFKEVLPEISTKDFEIDRIHRLPKPKHLPDKIPRDVLLRVHFFQIKEDFMKKSRNSQVISEKYPHLQFFSDVSQFTISFRRRFATVTKVLRDRNIPYRWGYPSKLIVHKDKTDFSITTLEQALVLLKKWKLVHDADLPCLSNEAPSRIEQDWHPSTTRKSPRPSASPSTT